MCAKTIEKTFEAMNQIKAKAIVSANKVIITYDETLYTLDKIARIIKNLGYQPIIKDDLENKKE